MRPMKLLMPTCAGNMAGPCIRAGREMAGDGLRRHRDGKARRARAELQLGCGSDLRLRVSRRRNPSDAAAAKAVAAGISNEEYFEILSRELTKALSEPTKEGYVFRVDLRLRRRDRSDNSPVRWTTIESTI